MAPDLAQLSSNQSFRSIEKSKTNEAYIPNPIKEQLSRNELAYAFTIKLCRSIEVVQMAKQAGYSGILIDLEHSPLSVEQTGQICIAALTAGICPIVRVPQLERHWISRTLDLGALGILVPHVKTVEDAKLIVDYSRFQPIGSRSAVAGLPHLGYQSFPTSVANEACNRATLVMVMIETCEALENVEEIAKVPGVDQLLIGTNDLTAELGIPGQYDDPKLEQAYQRVIEAAKKNNLSVGIGGLASRPDLVEKFAKMGARFVMAGTDQVLLMAAAKQNASSMASMRDRIIADEEK